VPNPRVKSLNSVMAEWLDSTDDLVDRVWEAEAGHGRAEDAQLIRQLRQAQILVAALLARKTSYGVQKYTAKLEE
jgi:hypothetical protein